MLHQNWDCYWFVGLVCFTNCSCAAVSIIRLRSVSVSYLWQNPVWVIHSGYARTGSNRVDSANCSQVSGKGTDNTNHYRRVSCDRSCRVADHSLCGTSLKPHGWRHAMFLFYFLWLKPCRTCCHLWNIFCWKVMMYQYRQEICERVIFCVHLHTSCPLR